MFGKQHERIKALKVGLLNIEECLVIKTKEVIEGALNPCSAVISKVPARKLREAKTRLKSFKDCEV